MRVKKFALIIICALLLASNIVPAAFADWYDDVKSGCTWVEIEGDEFVVDTFCGVEARYNESDYYYQCNELIMRFYKEAYGLDVMAYMNTGLIMLTEGYGFVEAKTPKKGDIIYVTAEMRNSGSDHWAIVKDYSNGYITMFEQNVIWEGKAALNRQIKYPSESYYLLTPVSLGSAPAPVLKGVEEETAKATTTTAKPTTTKATTTKPTTTSTTEPTTAKTTTTKPVTTIPTTTKITTTVPTTVTTTETTTLIYTSETSAFTVPETTEYKPLTEIPSTEAETEADTESSDFSVPIIAVCGVLAAGIAVMIVVLLKKKK